MGTFLVGGKSLRGSFPGVDFFKAYFYETGGILQGRAYTSGIMRVHTLLQQETSAA